MGGVMMYWHWKNVYTQTFQCTALTTAQHQASAWFNIIMILVISNTCCSFINRYWESCSEGHWEVNFMQHNMSSQTFKAEMAAGSWDGTPLFPDLQAAFSIMEKKMSQQAQSWVTTYTSSISSSSDIMTLFWVALLVAHLHFVTLLHINTGYSSTCEHSGLRVMRRWLYWLICS